MKKTQLMVALVFVVAFAAGLTSALVARQFTATPPRSRGAWMTAELNLTPDQEKQMQQIWGAMGRSSGQEEGEKRRALQKQRDEAIRALIPAERQSELEKILQDHQQAMNELAQQRQERYQAAVDKTKGLLTPDQLKKYEEILARRPESGRRDRGGPGGSGGFGGPGPGERERSRSTPPMEP